MTTLWRVPISNRRAIHPTVRIVSGLSRAARAGIVLPGVVVHPGEELFLRWSDVNDNGPDDGLAIDDFSMTWSPATR